MKVISGDNPHTASLIAARAGIPGADRYIDTSALETDEDFSHAVSENTVFGRVTPEKKRRLVAAMPQGHTVAMTGDGVNDLLAMKQADCSVAFSSGVTASQLGSLVLLNNDFAAMPGIVAEGRRVINNIQRAATLFLVKNIFSLFLSVISLFTDWPYPLQPMHLTVISALTIGIPSFFLAMEPNYDRVTGHFLRGVLRRRAFPGGLTNVFAVLVCQAFMVVFDLPAASIATVCVSPSLDLWHDGAVSGVQALRGVSQNRVGRDAGVSGRGVHLSWGAVRAAFRHGADEPSDADAAAHDPHGVFRHTAPVRLGRKDFPPRFSRKRRESLTHLCAIRFVVSAGWQIGICENRSF